MAAATIPLGLPCPGCRGGGEVNGVDCRECGGAGRKGARPRGGSWRKMVLRLADIASVPAGTAIRGIPGVGGAAAVTCGAAVIVHAAWHWIPWYGPAALVGGLFGLMIDRGL